MRKIILASVLLLPAAAFAADAPPQKPTYEQLEHALKVEQEVANTYYQRAIRAETQLVQQGAEQDVTAQDAASKAKK